MRFGGIIMIAGKLLIFNAVGPKIKLKLSEKYRKNRLIQLWEKIELSYIWKVFYFSYFVMNTKFTAEWKVGHSLIHSFIHSHGSPFDPSLFRRWGNLCACNNVCAM